MSASELVNHWQAEVNRLLAVHRGCRIANENMDPGRKWTGDETAHYAIYQEWAMENGRPTRPIGKSVLEYEAAQDKLKAALLVLEQQRTGNQTHASSFLAAGPDSYGGLRWEGTSDVATADDSDDAATRSGDGASSASFLEWSSCLVESR